MTSLSTSAPVAMNRPIYGWTLHDGLVVARRNLIQTMRVPELLFFSLVQPVIFVLLFAYVFGGAIPIPGDAGADAYRQYLMPGIFGQTVAFAAASSTVGLAEDMHKGLIDRFRALPMSPPAVLVGRTFADAARQILVLVVLSITGYLVGWRIDNGLLNAIWAYALLLLFAYTVAWIGSWIGLYMPNPETANTAGLVWLFPMTFLSNAFVPINALPGWLQVVAAWNPISALVLSCRELFGNPDRDPAGLLAAAERRALHAAVVRGADRRVRHARRAAVHAHHQPLVRDGRQCCGEPLRHLAGNRRHGGTPGQVDHGLRIDHLDDGAARAAAHDDVARQQESDGGLGLQRLMGETGVAGAEDDLRIDVDVDLGLQGGLHVDLGDDPESLVAERRLHIRDGRVEVPVDGGAESVGGGHGFIVQTMPTGAGSWPR